MCRRSAAGQLLGGGRRVNATAAACWAGLLGLAHPVRISFSCVLCSLLSDSPSCLFACWQPQSRVGSVVYGARNHLLGADGSWIAMLPQRQASGSSGIGRGGACDASRKAEAGAEGVLPAAAPPARPHPFHPNLLVRRGVLAAECGVLMRAFFARRRREQAAAAPASAEAVAAPAGVE